MANPSPTNRVQTISIVGPGKRVDPKLTGYVQKVYRGVAVDGTAESVRVIVQGLPAQRYDSTSCYGRIQSSLRNNYAPWRRRIARGIALVAMPVPTVTRRLAFRSWGPDRVQ